MVVRLYLARTGRWNGGGGGGGGGGGVGREEILAFALACIASLSPGRLNSL